MSRFSTLLIIVFAFVGMPVVVHAGAQDTVALDGVEVRAPTSVPIWELRRGNDRLIILSDYFPRRKSEAHKIDARAVRRIASEAEALVYGPGVAVSDSMSLWRGMWMWRAYREAMKNPNGTKLKDILATGLYQRWSLTKSRYMDRNRSVESLRPLYAAFKLYEAAMAHYDIADGNNVWDSLIDAFESRPGSVVDARYRITVVPDKRGVRSFTVSDEKGIACLAQTLDNLDPAIDSASEGADAWDTGDMDALRDYYDRVPPLARCWEILINQQTASQMEIPDPYQQADPHWLSVIDDLFKDKDTVVTYLGARTLVTQTGVVAKLIEQGWVLQRRP